MSDRVGDEQRAARVNVADRVLRRFVKDLTLGAPTLPPRYHPETREPGERSRLPLARRVGAYVLAVVLPSVTAVAMIPVRADHGRAAVIVLVVPVMVVALLGATGPAAAAAVCAALVYDLLLTEPYYSPAVDDPDEIVAAVTLAAVGLVVGVLNARLIRLTTRDAARRNELRQLVEFARTTTRPNTEDDLTREACEHIRAVLNLRRCRWHAGYHGLAGPVLLPDGNVTGFETALNPDRATLPDDLELPARAGATELGRFILTPTPHHVSSFEERLTAVSVAALYAGALTAIKSRVP